MGFHELLLVQFLSTTPLEVAVPCVYRGLTLSVVGDDLREKATVNKRLERYMPRPERTLDPTTSPVHAFAAELRTLREAAGNPTYLKMARATGKSRTALAEAAGGDHVPRWETVEAYVRACNGKPEDWRSKWEALQESREPPPAAIGSPSDPPDAAAKRSMPTRRSSKRHLLIWLTGSVLVVAAVVVLATMFPGTRDQETQSPSTTPQPSGPVAVKVQNKVAIGTELLEDFTPAYLSSKPIPFCGREGCKIEDTEMSSGAVLAVDCYVMGTELSNADLTSPGIEHNRHKHTSALWYRAVLPGDKTGYISEVYVAPEHRGGLGLPKCPDDSP
jgi:hypothetical protein